MSLDRYYDLVLVEWFKGSEPIDQWRDIEDIDEDIEIVRSVGWMLQDSPGFIQLAPNISANQHGKLPHRSSCDITIPKLNVKSVVTLMKARTYKLQGVKNND